VVRGILRPMTILYSGVNVLNITENTLGSFPTTSNGLGSINCPSGIWTEVVSDTQFSTPIYIYRIVGKNRSGNICKIAIGDEDSEIQVAEAVTTSYRNLLGSLYNTVNNCFEFPIPIEIPANTRISCDVGNEIRICYAIPSLSSGKVVVESSKQVYVGYRVISEYPAANIFTDWYPLTQGAIGLTGADTTAAYAISNIEIYARRYHRETTQTIVSIVEIGLGEAGFETTIIKVPFAFTSAHSGGAVQSWQYAARSFIFPILKVIPSGSRISARVANDQGSVKEYSYVCHLNGYEYPLR